MPIRQKPKYKTWFFRFERKGKSYFQGGFRSAALARDAESAFLRKIIEEEIYPERKGQDLPFKEAVEWYCSTHSVNKRTGYVDKARLGLAAMFFDNKKVSEIRPEDIESFLAKLPALRMKKIPYLKGLSDLTINHYLAMLRGLYNRLKKRGKWSGDNPAMGVSMKKVPRARVRFMYPAEEKLLSPIVMQDQEMWPYYNLALHTGMRIRELMSIQVKDVDLILGKIFIPNAKNSKSRYVPLSPNMAAWLAPMVVGKRQESSLLPNRCYSYIRKHFRQCCGEAGVNNLKVHDMRHTFAQRLLGKGESIYKVSKLLGHSSVVVTQTHYGHLADTDLSDSISHIDGVISCTQAAPDGLHPLSGTHENEVIPTVFGREYTG